MVWLMIYNVFGTLLCKLEMNPDYPDWPGGPLNQPTRTFWICSITSQSEWSAYGLHWVICVIISKRCQLLVDHHILVTNYAISCFKFNEISPLQSVWFILMSSWSFIWGAWLSKHPMVCQLIDWKTMPSWTMSSWIFGWLLLFGPSKVSKVLNLQK